MAFYLYQSISTHGAEIEYQVLLEGAEGIDIPAAVRDFYAVIAPGDYPALGYDHPKAVAWRQLKERLEAEFATRYGVLNAYDMDLRLRHLKDTYGLVQRQFIVC